VGALVAAGFVEQVNGLRVRDLVPVAVILGGNPRDRSAAIEARPCIASVANVSTHARIDSQPGTGSCRPLWTPGSLQLGETPAKRFDIRT
jgi:hypothetical protein